MKDMLTIGTRGSELALAQANEVKQRLVEAHPDLDLTIEIKVISTAGDRIQNRPLSEIGGKGLFTQEIEEQLLSGELDLAVHSTKDMPTQLPEGLELSCYLPREAVEDAFISHKANSIDLLPPGAVVGSASLRRQALIRRMRPDITVVNFRGKVQTRLRKLADGEVDATLLAVAGLNRLGMADVITSTLSSSQFVPAPGQGAICVESRTGDETIAAMLEPVHDEETATRLAAERAFLAALDGSCRTPLAALANVEENRVSLHGMILSTDGSLVFEDRVHAATDDAQRLGTELGEELRSRAGAKFFEDWD